MNDKGIKHHAKIEAHNYVNQIKYMEKNPLNIDIADYHEIVHKNSLEEEKERKNIYARNAIISCMVVLGFVFVGRYIILNNGILAFFIISYLLSHAYYIYSKIQKENRKSYSTCGKCQSGTFQVEYYNSDDISIYFCSKCKSFFRVYHMWDRSSDG